MSRTALVVLVTGALLAGCGESTDEAVTRGEDGERAVRQAVISTVPDLLRTGAVPVDDDTALRGEYRPCGSEQGRVQYVAEQVFVPASASSDLLDTLAGVLDGAGWTTRPPQRDILSAERSVDGEGVRLALSTVGPRLRLRVESACRDLGEDAAEQLEERRSGFVPL